MRPPLGFSPKGSSVVLPPGDVGSSSVQPHSLVVDGATKVTRLECLKFDGTNFRCW